MQMSLPWTAFRWREKWYDGKNKLKCELISDMKKEKRREKGEGKREKGKKKQRQQRDIVQTSIIILIKYDMSRLNTDYQHVRRRDSDWFNVLIGTERQKDRKPNTVRYVYVTREQIGTQHVRMKSNFILSIRDCRHYTIICTSTLWVSYSRHSVVCTDRWARAVAQGRRQKSMKASIINRPSMIHWFHSSQSSIKVWIIRIIRLIIDHPAS